MRERPILFSGPMVRAILQGRKTQTRRVAKVHETSPGYISPDPYFVPRTPQEHVSYCPYGIAGDRLWVRETWRPFYEKDTGAMGISYRAGGFEEMDLLPSIGLFGGDNWRPCIFMPRTACRITLEIVDVRIQRVREINESDAEQEGCSFPADIEFSNLWDSINAKRGFGWSINPWVWALTFKVEAH